MITVPSSEIATDAPKESLSDSPNTLSVACRVKLFNVGLYSKIDILPYVDSCPITKVLWPLAK